MPNAQSSYTTLEGYDLNIFLNIDLKTEIINDFSYAGYLSSIYKYELEELKSNIINQSYKVALNLKRENLKNEVRLTGNKLPIAHLSLWLLHQAIFDYLGNTSTFLEQNDLLCLCFGIGESELKKEILKRPDYSLKDLVIETTATSACGSCKKSIVLKMKNLREEYGLIFGLSHSQSRVDKDGNWIKIKGMYPGELLIKLDELKNIWMKREGILDQFQIEIKNIEGHHLWLTIAPAENIERCKKILTALGDYWHSETGALFFLHLFIQEI